MGTHKRTTVFERVEFESTEYLAQTLTYTGGVVTEVHERHTINGEVEASTYLAPKDLDERRRQLIAALWVTSETSGARWRSAKK